MKYNDLTKDSNPNLRVPYGQTVHCDAEIDAVVKVLKNSTQMGKHVKQMEARVAELYAKKHGVMVNSGSSANYLAVEVLDLPKGSEVITPALTFATTVAPLVKNDLIPTFIDAEEGTYNIDASKVEELITPNTKALMIPNLLGNLPDWKLLSSIAKKYNLLTIEDSADCLGSTIDDVSTGKYSDISTTSFYGSHIINCAGNGGMLCLNNDKLHTKATLLRSWGRRSSLLDNSEAVENRFNVKVDGIDYDSKFIFDTIGYNLEPSEMGAAFGLVQLDKLEHHISVRENHFSNLYNFFKSYESHFILPKQLPKSRTGWLAFPLCVRDKAPFSRKEVQIFLENKNIQTRTILAGNILKQPGFSKIKRKESKNGYPVTNQVMKGGFLIGVHHGLDDEQMNHIKSSFTEFLTKY